MLKGEDSMRLNRQQAIKRLKDGEKLYESGNTKMFKDGNSVTAETDIYLREHQLVKGIGRLGHRIYSWNFEHDLE